MPANRPHLAWFAQPPAGTGPQTARPGLPAVPPPPFSGTQAGRWTCL